MSNTQKLKKTFTTVLLLFFVWTIYLIFIFFNGEKLNENKLFIPKNASFVCRIDARDILSKSAQQVLIKDQNEQLFRTFKNLLNQPDRKKSSEVGIDIFSDVYLFSLPYKDGKLVGISFNLLNTRSFQKNISEYISKNQIHFVKKTVGFIFQFIPNEIGVSIPIVDLKNHIENKLDFTPFSPKTKSENDIEIQVNRTFFDPSTSIHSSNLIVQLKDDSFEFSGDMNLKKSIDQKSTFLKPNTKSFHFSSLYAPKTLSDSLKSILNRNGIDFPEIKSLSMNYSGIEFGNLNNEMVVIPEVDFVITSKTPFSIDHFLKTNLSKIHDEIQYLNNQIIVGKYIFYVQQINPCVFYIGRTKKPDFVNNNQLPILEMSGDLNYFTNVKGGGFMMSILEMYPLYKSSKTFLSGTQKLDIKLTEIGQNKVKLKGNLKFKAKHFVATDLLLFILSSGL